MGDNVLLLQTIAYCAVGTFSIFGLLTLLPLWIGMTTSHPRRRRLALVPSIPFAVSALIINVIIILLVAEDINGTDLISDFWVFILGTVAGTTGFSAFISWIVTWVLFNRWRTGN